MITSLPTGLWRDGMAIVQGLPSKKHKCISRTVWRGSTVLQGLKWGEVTVTGRPSVCQVLTCKQALCAWFHLCVCVRDVHTHPHRDAWSNTSACVQITIHVRAPFGCLCQQVFTSVWVFVVMMQMGKITMKRKGPAETFTTCCAVVLVDRAVEWHEQLIPLW